MVDSKTLNEKPMSMSELKEEIVSIKKRDKEVNFRVTQTEEYLESFVHHPAKDIIALKKEIEKMEIPRLKEQHICKIVDILPDNIDDLKTVLEGYPITIVDKNLKRIADLVKEFKEKKQ
ncbi:MAG: hypothetical protein NTV63_01375 [Candidatus Woesearchaeota archaeon]|nr:hypothetical protein [Candidatus Woesearchaeota archaeon]